MADFDWMGLWQGARYHWRTGPNRCKLDEESGMFRILDDQAAATYLREQIEAAFVPLSVYGTTADCLSMSEAALTIRAEKAEAEVARLREILSFDCTAFPDMEEAAIKWADKISGPRGGKPHHPDPVGILLMCEEIANTALGDAQ